MDAKLPQNTTVGFIGLGRMGNPMARNLRRGDYKVVGYDIREEAVAALAGVGVAGARSVAEVGERADVVITMVPDSQAVEEVALGPEGLIHRMAGGKVCVDMSSSYPASTEKVGKILAERGIGMLGAPVTGGVAGAEGASLTIMVG
ncbi:MAG: NAD(P)-dependent oxidoreductase, partial [Nitrospinota bacterium]